MISCTTAEAVRYYNTIGREFTPAMMKWSATGDHSRTLKNFSDGMKALEELESKNGPEIPKISKSLPMMKWAPAFESLLSGCYGVRKPLSLLYARREKANQPNTLLDDS